MNSTRVKRAELLKKVKANRKTHRKIYAEAVEGYRKALLREFEARVEELRTANGRVPDRTVNIVEPQVHIEEYDLAIAMLEMSTEKEVVVTAQQFNQLVLDNWGWKQLFLSSNSAYSATAASMS